jgi:hypothetical protein
MRIKNIVDKNRRLGLFVYYYMYISLVSVFLPTIRSGIARARSMTMHQMPGRYLCYRIA